MSPNRRGFLALGSSMGAASIGRRAVAAPRGSVIASTWDFGAAANAAAAARLQAGGSLLDAIEAGARVPEVDPANHSVGYDGSATLSCPDQSCTIRNGGFNLAPETAHTKTFGIVLRPRFIRGLTISVDRFLIDLKDAINYFSANDFLSGCLATQNDYYCRGIVRNPGTFTLSSPTGSNPATGYIAQGTGNGFKATSHGWDFQGQYDKDLGGVGRMEVSFNGSLITNSGGQDAPDIAARNCVGYYGPFCGESLPKWKHNLFTTWRSADRIGSISLNWRHIGPMTLTYNATDTSLGIPVTAADRRNTYGGIRAYDYFDLSAAIDIAQRMTLRLSVNNVFDRDPPLVPDTRNLLCLLRSNTVFGYDQLGRQIVIGASTRF